jgi:prepilin signal peptidase PulO-like enzyme (type II secretory pathway)
MSVILLALLGCIGLSRTNFLRKMTRWGYLPALQMKSEVPFAPFLIIGLLIVYVLGYNLFIFGL